MWEKESQGWPQCLCSEKHKVFMYCNEEGYERSRLGEVVHEFILRFLSLGASQTYAKSYGEWRMT